MTRPEDIPTDIWDRAVEVTFGTMAFGSPRLTKGIAHAILAERQRCVAKLNAERVLPFYVDPSDDAIISGRR